MNANRADGVERPEGAGRADGVERPESAGRADEVGRPEEAAGRSDEVAQPVEAAGSANGTDRAAARVAGDVDDVDGGGNGGSGGANVVTADALADGLARLEAGQPLADVLARHPGSSDDLAGLVGAADALRRLPPRVAPTAFRAALADELASRERALRDAEHGAGRQRRLFGVLLPGPRGAAAIRRALVAAAMVAMAVAGAGLAWAASTGRLGQGSAGDAPATAAAGEARDVLELASATATVPIRRAGAVSGAGQAVGEARDDAGERGDTGESDAAGRERKGGLAPPAVMTAMMEPRWPSEAIDGVPAVAWNPLDATPVHGAIPPIAEPGDPGSSSTPVVAPGPIGAPGGEPEPTAAKRSTSAPAPPTPAPTLPAAATSTAAPTGMASPTSAASPTAEPTREPTEAPTPYPWPTLAPGSASLAGAVRIDDGAGGRPLAGATVRLHAVDGAFPPAGCDVGIVPPVASNTTTDLDGRFAFDGIGAGRYVVSATDACVDGTFWNGLGAADVVVDACGALAIPLADGQAAGSANVAVPAAAAERCPLLTR